MQKECKVHGLTDYALEGRGYYRCKKCRYQAVKDRRLRIKRLLVDYKGGCCTKCGYDRHMEVLDFHHVDPTQKDFTVSHQTNWSLDRLKAEVDKCVLLCANCHREEHIMLD